VPVLVTVLVVRFILDLMDQTLLVLPPSLRPDALFAGTCWAWARCWRS